MTTTADAPHHDGSPLYVSPTDPELGDDVRVRVLVPRSFGPVEAVHVRSVVDHEPRYGRAIVVASDSHAVWWEAAITLGNPSVGYRFLITRPGGKRHWLNARGLFSVETPDSEDFRMTNHPAAPDWATSSVLYEIFPDRFARSEAADARLAPEWARVAEWSDPVERSRPATSVQFYGGDLAGIEERLDHLVRLGVTLVYLTPVFPARSNHRYDALSFDEVDPVLGGDDALVSLIEAVHSRGLRIIGDLTSNHSGDAHEWFRSSHRVPEAPESDFYYWLDPEHDQYESWLGARSLPKFNWSSAELRRRFIEGPDSVVARWLKPPFNLDGWRIDVANMTGRYRAEDLNQDVRRTIRRTMMDVNAETLLLAESTNDAASDFTGDGWHGAMTYANFTRPLWGWLSVPGSSAGGFLGPAQATIPSYTGRQFYDAHSAFVAAFPWQVRLCNMNALDTHDTPRFLTHAMPGVLAVAFGMSVTLPGIPVIWAGDEFGLTGIDGEDSRTPLPWGDLESARETIELYSGLIRLRTGNSALNGGGMRWLHVGDDVLVFVREDATQSVVVVASRADADVTLPAGAVGAECTSIYGDVEYELRTDGALRLVTRGPTFAALKFPGVTLPSSA